MGSYILRFMGVDSAGFDPFGFGGSVSASAVATTTPLPDYPLNNQSSFYASSDGQRLLATQTALSVIVNGSGSAPVAPAPTMPQIQPTFTPYPAQPTFTPYPTQRPITGSLLAIGYSYYWPPWGPPNCDAGNWHDRENFCDDVTASGLRWSDYVGRGVAVPWEWQEDIPLGSTIRVHSPLSMIGDYIVLDLCGSCIKPEGHVYFDFLDNRARLNFTVPMLVEVIK